MTTALVLTGGGSLGAVQVGMLREVLACGIEPDFIVGVSAGALNGAFLAEDLSVATLDRMIGLWSRVTTREILGLSWRSMLALVGLRDHFADSRGLSSLLARELRARIHIVPPLCPLSQSAYDYSNGAELIRRAQHSTEAWIAAGGLNQTGFPGALHDHEH